MTLEQLMSPKVTEWIDRYNRQLNEGKVNQSDEEFFADFENWFNKNENKINESVKNSQRLNEGVFSDLFDEEEESPEEEPFKDDEPETLDDEDDEDEAVSHDPRVKHRVDNSKNSKRNVFNVVNILYEKICKEGKNMDKVTYFKFLDTSGVRDMTALLAFTNLPNADLSSWDTSGVINMEGMFYKSTFNNDSICDWNVSSCADFKNMFLGSKFNQSLSRWKPKMVTKKEIVYDEETGEKHVEEVEKRAPLPFVGAYEDEEKEMDVAFWDEKFKDGIKESKKSKYTHFMDFETFLVNEGLWDKTKQFGKKIVNKVKEMFKVAALKIDNYLVSFIGEHGEAIPATNPYTTLNYISTGKVEGVHGYSPVANNLLNTNVKNVAEHIGNEGYYNVLSEDKDSNMYENMRTFMNELKKIQESNGEKPFDVLLNEDRVGFSAKSGGLRGVMDINTSELRDEIRWRMMSTPGERGKDAMGALLIWGAPGVGKSTIPNAIIDAYNENAKKEGKSLKSLIVAECGDMTPDGFALPMPVRVSMEEYVKARPGAKKLAAEIGLTDEEMAKSIITRSDDAPKMWIPCYKPDPDKRINEVRKMVANGHVREYYDENGEYKVEETTDGGIIMFDEFFRADASIFKILMQILLNRSYGGFTLGDKWGIIACSNRPGDDEEVDRTFANTGAVVTTRVTQYNFIPDFNDWRKWAESKGHFDDITLGFLVKDKDSNGEFTNWHNIDTEKHTEGEVAHPTPRTWSQLMLNLWNIMKMEGYRSIGEIPERVIRRQAAGTIGDEMGEKYVDFVKHSKGTVLNVRDMFTDSSYIIPDPIPSAAEMSERVVNFVEATYLPSEPPTEEELMNMFNLINKTYSKTKDNYFKQMHIDIIKHFSKSGDIKAINKYCKECITRYDIQRSDLAG